MTYNNILLVKLRAMGDTVLALPSLQALRQGFPKARISMLVPSHSLEFFDADSRVDEVIVYPRERLGGFAWRNNVEFYQSLQERHFDLAVCLHASFRTALLGWLSGAETRVIRNHSGADWFSTLPIVEPKEPKSIVQRDFDAMRALGLKPRDERPKLMLSAKARTEAARLAKKQGLKKGRTVLFFPYAGKIEKEWPMSRFRLLKSSLERRGIASAWVAAPGREGIPGALKAEHVLTLGALCEFSGWVIGNDSGPRHIAAASGAKTLTLFGPEALREWHPYLERDAHVAIKSTDGSMDSILLDDVREATWRWLKK